MDNLRKRLGATALAGTLALGAPLGAANISKAMPLAKPTLMSRAFPASSTKVYSQARARGYNVPEAKDYMQATARHTDMLDFRNSTLQNLGRKVNLVPSIHKDQGLQQAKQQVTNAHSKFVNRKALDRDTRLQKYYDANFKQIEDINSTLKAGKWGSSGDILGDRERQALLQRLKELRGN